MNERQVRLVLFVSLMLSAISMTAPTIANGQEKAEAFFETRIRPLLVERCLDCHNADDPSGGLALDSKAGWSRGGESGPAIVPRDPASSLLIRAVSAADSALQMPPLDSGEPLTDAEIDDLTLWVRQGAFDPRDGHRLETDIERQASTHWAFQPIQRPTIESVTTSTNPIDAVVNRLLLSRGFEATESADVRTLVRRATFDLHGLPPSAAQLAISRNSFPQLVDDLLASPRFGERWGRHWLDVARYSDAKDGVLMYGDARIRPFAYTYRDYVIRSFNEDKPFDRFIKEQLAADQLGLAADSPELAAMGLLTLGRMFDLNRHDVIDDQIDVVTRGFLGLTATCARCHDHKFDPIPTADYYSLYGIFASSIEPYEQPRIGSIPPAGEAFEREYAAQLNRIKEANEAHYERTLDTARRNTVDYLVQVATTEPDLAETAIYFKSLLPDQLRPQIIHRWRTLIAQRAFPDDPVFGPWYDLMRSPELKVEAWRSRGIDERVIAALGEFKPTTPEAVATTYGKLLVDIYVERQTIEDEIAQIKRELAAIESRAFDLADIVGGGNGLGTGQQGRGIHPATGKPTTGESGFIDGLENDVLIPVPSHPFVDGIFVPRDNATVISSTGIRIEDLKSTSGKSWDYFKDGPSSGFTVTSVDAIDYSSAPHSMLAVHANKGITFDLQAMRDEYEFDECRLQCVLGNLGAKGESLIDFAVYLDGTRAAVHHDVESQGAGIPIDVEIPVDRRFLTIVITEGGRGISHDQAILGDPQIVLPAPPPRTSKLAKLHRERVERLAHLTRKQPSPSRPETDPLAALLMTHESPVWFPIHQIEYYLSRQDRDAYRGMVNQLDAIAVRSTEAAPRALTLRDSEALIDPVIFQRGDPSQPGAPVPRAFLSCLAEDDRDSYDASSGRLELAEAIASPDNPLTARVWANRVWMHHFGKPLVDDPSDFGLRTEQPIQLELLDLLATQLIENGWRIKPLHRLIMTSQVWQRSSSIPEHQVFQQQLVADPENRLLWHAERRRLDLEQMRDAILHVSGQLDTTAFGRPSTITDLTNHRRTVYAFVERQNIPNMVQVFDFASPDTSTGRRPETTVPQQALFAMNSPFVQQAAEELALRVTSLATADQQVSQLFQLTLSRQPNQDELREVKQFLTNGSLVDVAHVLLMSNEFMFVD